MTKLFLKNNKFSRLILEKNNDNKIDRPDDYFFYKLNKLETYLIERDLTKIDYDTYCKTNKCQIIKLDKIDKLKTVKIDYENINSNLNRFYRAQTDKMNIKKKKISSIHAIKAAFLDLTTPTKDKKIKKEGCWIWYIYPQFVKTDLSSTSTHYAIKSVAEGIAYLTDPFLRHNLIIMTELILTLDNIPLTFGHGDTKKIKSFATLFEFIAMKTDDPLKNLFSKVVSITGKDISSIQLINNST